MSETLYPMDFSEDGQVVRAIYENGAAPEYILYPHVSAAKWARWREERRWIPQFVVAALDQGMPVDQNFMEAQWDYQATEEADAGRMSHAA
jgi:hypothetical protein